MRSIRSFNAIHLVIVFFLFQIHTTGRAQSKSNSTTINPISRVESLSN